MKTQYGVILCLLSIGAICLGQDEGGFKKKTRAPVVATNAPVTEAEAEATFTKVIWLFKTVLHVRVAPTHLRGASGGAVTRSEVIAEFVRLYKAVEPSFTLTPKSVPMDLSRLTVDKPSERPLLVMMVERGCVGNYGPLATGKKSTLNVQDFGDSVGYFLARIGECTHVPSSKWTPYLHS